MNSEDILPEIKTLEHAKARIILLEAAVDQSISTISFLHGCLTDDAVYRYGYPEQTIDRLKYLETLVKPSVGCVHSMTKQDCEQCQERLKSWKLADWAEKTLNEKAKE